jgi:hypothetical protein
MVNVDLIVVDVSWRSLVPQILHGGEGVKKRRTQHGVIVGAPGSSVELIWV